MYAAHVARGAGAWWWHALRVGITVGAFAYLFSLVPLGELWQAVITLPWQIELAVLVLLLVGHALGLLRWRLLMAACGASHLPDWGRLWRLVMVGNFYNQYVPGAVGGDIVRGMATGDAFEQGGVTRALAVTLLDRIMGFAGLLGLASAAFALRPIDGVEGLATWLALGAGIAATSILVVTTVGRFTRGVQGALGRFLARLPEVRTPSALVLAWMISLGTHAVVTLSAHAFVSSLAEDVSLAASFVVMPVSNLAAYFPLTVGGAGAWELAIVELYSLIGVDRADALAGALVLRFCYLLIGALGGLLAVAHPIGVPANRAT